MKTVAEIKKTLEHLIYYNDVKITHDFFEYRLIYIKETKEFLITNKTTGEAIEKCKDIETCTKLIYTIFNKSLPEKVAE